MHVEVKFLCISCGADEWYDVSAPVPLNVRAHKCVKCYYGLKGVKEDEKAS